MPPISTKPYLIRAIYEWCVDNGLTPHLSVAVDQNTRVPMEFVKEGQIVLNLSASATRNLTMDNDWIQFSARFGGISRELQIPIAAVVGIFARENGEGMGFAPETPTDTAHSPEPDPPQPTKPRLKIVK
ncbi:stringent starvation protein B [Sulfuriferula plumbiphila]|uniref:Stringent starvation protein B n=1 Tax=Sulfuriferula plumbiphila TaxID=171865 RepID=A0A512LB68_9PROT|nr:ClpXP protease specificity-enhancing factor [Sulfuriferula plumbiphila]BBP04344.1 stringent starvation protein B [Sulfuriferula plumbiphila]GEP31728.1 stringent starvation protein B [Sulfuriferula plumbiphila]